MNRSKHIGLALLALLCCILATAQSTVTKCEYWLDQQFDSRQTITDLTNGEWETQADFSDLAPGLHRMSIRTGTDDGRWSPPVMKYFLIPQMESAQENSLSRYEYWIDKQFDDRVSGTFVETGVIDMNLDLTTLDPGLHSIAFRAVDDNGHFSPVVVKFFLIPQTESTQENALAKYEYWIDKQFDNRVSGTFDETGVIDMDLDLTTLDPGLHSIAFRVVDDNGHFSPVVIKFFLIPQTESTQENALSRYEYWIDKQFDNRVSGTFDETGVIDMDLDLTTLAPGLHSIAFRAVDDNGHFSPVVVKFFLIPQTESTQENALSKYEYWIDKQFDNRVSGTFDETGVIDMDLDLTTLAPGLHSIAFRAVDGNGHFSPVVVKFFLIPQTESTQENALSKYEYWIDKQFDNRVSGTFDETGVIDMDLDLTTLAPGLHSIAFRAVDDNGHVSPTTVKYFIVPEEKHPTDKIVAYEYWFNNQPRKRVEVDSSSVVTIDADITIEGVAPDSVLSDYVFDAKEKTVTYTHDVIFGLQVFNSADVGSSAIMDTIRGHKTIVEVPFSELALEQVHAMTAPTGCVPNGYLYKCQPGDTIYWFVKAESQHIDFFDEEGDKVTVEDTIIKDEKAWFIKAPTATLYALAYGAISEGKEDTVRVTQPVTITLLDCKRTYGEDNPDFTYKVNRPDLLVGTPAGMTDAIITSPVGEYAITLDPNSINNTLATITEATLTIEKAVAKITANNVEMSQGDDMPDLTWTVTGLMNEESIEEIFSILPICHTEATKDSPDGTYEVTVDGAEATNYTFVYEAGLLTIYASTGITVIYSDSSAPTDVYTILGIKVRNKEDSFEGLTDGVYVMKGKKVLIRKK
ncbi:MAG: hypothetical protein IJ916_06060 [Paludibacteraceae bacterium]|nr:hypothetical protein [Paludibacteraceae bacterium]